MSKVWQKGAVWRSNNCYSHWTSGPLVQPWKWNCKDNITNEASSLSVVEMKNRAEQQEPVSSFEPRLRRSKGVLRSCRLNVMPHLARQLTYLTDMEKENYHAAAKGSRRFVGMNVACCLGSARVHLFSQPSVCKTETAWSQTDNEGFQNVRGSNFEHNWAKDSPELFYCVL